MVTLTYIIYRKHKGVLGFVLVRTQVAKDSTTWSSFIFSHPIDILYHWSTDPSRLRTTLFLFRVALRNRGCILLCGKKINSRGPAPGPKNAPDRHEPSVGQSVFAVVLASM